MLYLISPCLGLIVGAIELLTRFRTYLRPIFCLQGALFLATHAVMAWLAYVIVINFGDLLEAGSIPAKVLKNPYYVGVFCGLGYGALWRSKFFDFKSPVGKEKNIGFMTIFDGLLNYLMDRLEDIYSGAKIAKANELLKGKTIQNLPDHIKANLAGYRRLREEDKNEILKEIEEFNSKIANGGPAEIVIYGLVHKVVDHIGMGSLEDFIKTMK